MKRVHIISIGDPHMCDLAVALRKKGYEVSGSGADIIDSVKNKLDETGVEYSGEGWHPELLRKGIDFVIPSMKVTTDNPELKKAGELGLLTVSFPEFIFHQTRDKIRVVISGSQRQGRLLSMMLYALRKQNMKCDYVGLQETGGSECPIALSYDSRIVLLEADECATSKAESRPKHFFYRPHILLVPNLIWMPSDAFPTFDSYFELFKEMIVLIERDGKFIFNEEEDGLKALGERVRDDITAIPYRVHETVRHDDTTELVTRYGNFPLKDADEGFLSDVNAARLTCRQLGVKDKDFYSAISEYSFLEA